MNDPDYKNPMTVEDDYVNEDIDFVIGKSLSFIPLEKETIREVTKRSAIPRMEEETINHFKRPPKPDVFGNIFDRIEFLQSRINEVQKAMDERTKIHNAIIKDIDTDISEKNTMVNQITDLEEKRNFKLDISILRKEKRTESINFWRDMTELRTELRDLLESFETEKRITSVFKDVGGFG